MVLKPGRYLYNIELGPASAVSEEQGKYVLRGEELFPAYDEIMSPDDIRSAERVATALQAIDWSFTADNTGFLTHDLHPYPAKFIPQIPGHCIAQLSMRGELVLDPFGGSGTTALEAVRLGRRALSVDANEVGTLIGRVKTCNLDHRAAKDLKAIRSMLITRLVDPPAADTLCKENSDFIPEISNIDKWFPTTSRGELALIKSCIAKMESEKARNMSLLRPVSNCLSCFLSGFGNTILEQTTLYTARRSSETFSMGARRYCDKYCQDTGGIALRGMQVFDGRCKGDGTWNTKTGFCRFDRHLSSLWKRQRLSSISSLSALVVGSRPTSARKD